MRKYFKILVGAPATGKSTWIDKYDYRDGSYDIHSTDDIVMEMSPTLSYDEAWTKNIKEAEKEFWARVEDSIARRRNVIIDRTNMNRKSRNRFLAMILNMRARDDYHVSAEVFGLDLPVHEWYSRLNSRPGKTIPDNILRNMITTFEHPSYDEGFDSIVNWE